MTEQASLVLDVQKAEEAREPVRLNLGGRDRPIKGFLTIDVFEGPTVDITGDISKLDMFKDGTVEVIYASHCLEHFSHIDTLRVLKEWHRVLKQRGKLYVGVPDFQAVVEIYKKDGFSEWMRNFLWGDQIYDKAFHYTGFDYQTLAATLVKAGFVDVKKLVDMPFKINDCSTLRYGAGHKLVSLNVEATK